MPNQILLRAADRIEKLGWCQHNYGVGENGNARRPGGLFDKEPDQSPVRETCPIGAIRAVAGNDDKAGNEAKARLYAFLGVKNLADWNDDPKRTKAEVVAAMRKAAQ